LIGHLPVDQISGTDTLLIALAVIAAAIVVGLYLWWIGWALFKKPLTGAEALVGKLGVVYSDVTTTEGEVTIDGVIWKARLAQDENQKLSKGENIIVVSISSLTLFVRKPKENEKGVE
jgi:membrane protein implicated in regulation of membrane protease activity